jgi:ribose transport system ATP-binding protein
VLYISHRLDEVLQISDDVAVLRGGRLIGRWSRGTIDRSALTNEIVGREVESVIHQPSAAPGRRHPVLEIEHLQRLPRVRDVTLDLAAGEILGLAGLVGAGRTELARLLFGADRPTAGSMTLGGRAYAPRSPFDAIRRGVALVPEERRSEGLLLAKSIAFNVSLATMEQSRGRLALLSPARLRAAAREVVGRLGVQAASVNQAVAELSGGNQQKLVIGKYMRTAPEVLILDEPTVGVDVGARAEIYKIIRGPRIVGDRGARHLQRLRGARALRSGGGDASRRDHRLRDGAARHQGALDISVLRGRRGERWPTWRVTR